MAQITVPWSWVTKEEVVRLRSILHQLRKDGSPGAGMALANAVDELILALRRRRPRWEQERDEGEFPPLEGER